MKNMPRFHDDGTANISKPQDKTDSMNLDSKTKSSVFGEPASELEYWKELALRAEAEIERLLHIARTMEVMAHCGSLADGIYESWKSVPAAMQPEIFDGLLDALGRIGDNCRFCDLSKTRGHRELKKELRRFWILRASRQNQKVLLPLTLENWFLKKVKVYAAIQNRSVNNFIWCALSDAIKRASEVAGLNTDADNLNAQQIKSLRARAKFIKSKVPWGLPIRN
jgi:hypothetical protein